MYTINRLCFTIIQLLLLSDSTNQSHVRQAIKTIKAIFKTRKSPLFKPIGNSIKKPTIKTFDNTIKNSVSMFRRNKNTTKSFVYGLQEKYFRMQSNFGNKQLIRTKVKKYIYMRSAGQVKGKELRSLIKIVSKSKRQLPLLFFAGGLEKLTQFNLVPKNKDLNLEEKDSKNIEKVEYYREKYNGTVEETMQEQLLRMHDKQTQLSTESYNIMNDIVKLKNLNFQLKKNLYNKSSSRLYRDDLIDKTFISEKISKEISFNKNPAELQPKQKFSVDLDKILNENIYKKNCPSCLEKIRFYCTNCNKCILQQSELPKVTLPIDINIIKHTKQHIFKSSVYPLTFLSEKFKISQQPGNFSWKEVKDLQISEKGHNYVLYPHKKARLIKDQPKEEQESIKSIKIIDCHWGQTKALMKNIPENTKFIKQNDYKSTFWKYHSHDAKCLSSVEATYYLLKEYDQACSKLCKTDENLNLDNVLFFYLLQYKQIKNSVVNKSHTKNQIYFDQIEKLKKIESVILQ